MKTVGFVMEDKFNVTYLIEMIQYVGDLGN